jgi:hypothetical protein
VSENSHEEAARKSGVDTDHFDTPVELGILKPDSGEVFGSGDMRGALD